MTALGAPRAGRAGAGLRALAREARARGLAPRGVALMTDAVCRTPPAGIAGGEPPPAGGVSTWNLITLDDDHERGKRREYDHEQRVEAAFVAASTSLCAASGPVPESLKFLC